MLRPSSRLRGCCRHLSTASSVSSSSSTSSSTSRSSSNDEAEEAAFLRAHPPRAIDVHTHMYPPASYMKLLRSRTEVPCVVSTGGGGQERLLILPGEDEESTTAAGRPIGDEYYSVDRKLEFMDRHGIQASIVSLANPWVDFLPPQAALRVAAEVNDELQRMSELSHGRIFGFGAIAAHAAKAEKGQGGGGGGDGARAVVRELERVASMSGMRGIILGAHELDHPGIEPIYEACSRLGLIIFLHPHYGLGDSSAGLLHGYGHVLPLALGFPFETSIAVSRLILSGALDRHPALTCLLAHAGGTLPFLAGRLDSCLASDPDIAQRIRHAPSEYLRRNFLYDGLIYHRAGLEALLAFLGPDGGAKVCFGTDHPFFPPPAGAGTGMGQQQQHEESPLWASATKNVRIAWEAERAAAGDGDGGGSGGEEGGLWESIMWRNASRLLRIPMMPCA